MRTRFLTLTSWLVLAACGTDHAETGMEPESHEPRPWSSWGYDDDNSRANTDESALGKSTLADLTVSWELDGPGVTSTPVVVGDVVYFGTWEGHVLAVALKDGKRIWDFQVSTAPVSASVAVHAGRVYASAGNEVFALEHSSGKVVWSTEVDAHPSTSLFSTPVPIAEAGLLVIGVASVELVEEKDDYTFRGSVVALALDSGKERWRFYVSENDATSGAGVSVWSSAAVDRKRGLVYIGTGNTYEQPASPLSDSLLALRYEDGTLAWSRQFTKDDVYTVLGTPPQGPDADVGATPNLFRIGARDVVGVGDKAGVYSVLDRDSGETVWATQVGEGSALGGIMTAAAVHDGVIYVTSNRWHMSAALPAFDDPANDALAVALDATKGKVLWKTTLSAPSFGAVAWANDVVYVTTTEGDCTALAASDGKQLWIQRPGSEMGGGVTVSSGHLMVGHGFSLFKAPSEVTGGLVVYGLPGR